MKKYLPSAFLLLAISAITAGEASDPGPLETTLKTALWGAGTAVVGYGLKEAVNFSKAQYTRGFPSTVISTSESRCWLAILSCAGAGLVAERTWRGKRESCFEKFLTLGSEDKNRLAGNVIEIGVTTAVAYTILTEAAHQSPADAAICIAAGGLLGLLR